MVIPPRVCCRVNLGVEVAASDLVARAQFVGLWVGTSDLLEQLVRICFARIGIGSV